MTYVKNNFPLLKLNTFNLNVTCMHFFEFSKSQLLIDLLKDSYYRNLPKVILGNGSNILFTKKFDGLVIRPVHKGIKIIEENADSVIVKVGSNESWDDFTEFAANKNFYGIENLAGIPGTVGAAPIQNIGAYGQEVCSSIHFVSAINIETGEKKDFYQNDCEFGYRDSIFKSKYKNQYIILTVHFKLSINPDFNLSYGNLKERVLEFGEINISNIRKAVLTIRKEKLPDYTHTGNAGSFFKNPVVDAPFFKSLQSQFPNIPFYLSDNTNYKIPAAWLIEKCGWKAYKDGTVGVYEKQPLILINLGNAKGQDIVDLAHKISDSVKKRFGIKLQTEVNII
ncbi:MAG: UDP-N-acetylenolpyruvoylglucosamine reductase [Bacteroidetes bacterium RIFOXYA12_FULL_35_11]|nr:MAG: UDP-N-acetylenolpyruvoylglucosamine reductase [Bacteroidetes bacterium GWF2_35_48]OFY77183.1 MAG: UDP-N-acetylenolpyruvoylglucosamine reductase [Bacteroidetes bacterium RIFOXYA12_FULL_35_11]OFY95625.1 MAG: UDP-N-acetylenolpyruvoylglucosamine reductase [Bacteroidetes bacterium RIFOXYC12_FULL_35_7]